MRFRNAFHITIDNFSSAFKMLLYRLVVAVITFSLVYVILRLALDTIVQSAEVATIRSMIGDFFHALFGGDSAGLQAFQDNFHTALANFLSLLARNGGAIAGAVVGVCLMYLLSRFLNGLCLFALAGAMNDRMSLFARTSFSASYFKNLGKAALYEVIYVPLAFVYDALSVLACWFFFFYVPSFLPSWGILTVILSLCLTVTLIVCLESLKMTLVSVWIPAVISGGKRVGEGLKEALTAKKGFWRRFASYLAAVYIIIAMNAMFALFTIGSALFITVPLSFLFLVALQFVHYFEDRGKKYFISVHDIAGSSGRAARADDLLTEEDSLEALNRQINEPASGEEAQEKADGQDGKTPQDPQS